MKKGFTDYLLQEQADIVCVQEAKITEDAVPKLDIPYAHQYWHSASKKGYSGTGILSHTQPLTYTTEFTGEHPHPQEGRVQTAEFTHFYLVNVYVPNSKRELARLPYRQNEWDPDLRLHLQRLAQTKPVIACGDFNVAHQEIDLARPKNNRRNAGFTDEERSGFTRLLDAGFIDTFRSLHPDKPAQYSWWSYRANARANNVGWRIDYVLASNDLQPKLKDAFIRCETFGSDHCPVGVVFALNNP